MFLIIPERNATKKQITIVKITVLLVTLGLVALIVWGVVLIADYNNLWGILPISVAAMLSLAQIVAGIILFKKHH